MMLRPTDRNLKLFFYLVIFFLLSTQITKNKNVNKDFVIKLNNIIVTGLSDENNYQIYQNLKFLLKKNIFFIDKNNFQNVLEKNALVEHYNVKKIYPNLIKIEIKQADLLAITNYDNKRFYIGSNGKLISSDKIKGFNSNLPFVYSKSNYVDFIKLKKIIDASGFQFQQIESFYYFPSNRWDIKTKDGFLIKLPEKNLEESLNWTLDWYVNKEKSSLEKTINQINKFISINK